MIPLDELPPEILQLIADAYRTLLKLEHESLNQSQRTDAASTLQAALHRHRTQRCEDPQHAGYVTYTPRRIPCYEATFAHKPRVVCRHSRAEHWAQVRARFPSF